MRAAIYARVSSLAQRDRYTIASQLSTLPPWIASQGWTLVDLSLYRSILQDATRQRSRLFPVVPRGCLAPSQIVFFLLTGVTETTIHRDMTNTAQTTKATAKRIAAKRAAGLAVEICSDMISIWYDLDTAESAETAKDAIVADLGGEATVRGNGSKFDIYYSHRPADMGDWNDVSARCHY